MSISDRSDRQFAERIAERLGSNRWITDADSLAPWLSEPRGLFTGRCLGMALPETTEDVAWIVDLCRETGTPITPQGGNTGLVGGSVPFDSGREIILSTRRMKRIRSVEPANFSLVAEAGCSLSEIQDAAEECDRLFPLSYASEGTATIGGAVSCNSGGVQVLRYGNCRDLVLGLEAVLPDGKIWHGLRALRKDNTGYDLKQLFIGAEGTLGIVTAASLKLFSRPRVMATAFVALPEPKAAMTLLSMLREESGDLVTAFEFMDRTCLDLVFAHIPDCRDPFDSPWPCYVLLQLSAGALSDEPGEALNTLLETMLGHALEEELVLDAVIASSQAQANAFWRIRETLPEAQTHEGGSIKHDISVPVHRMADFLAAGTARVQEIVPGARPVPFGHVGDGNVHFNISQPPGADRQEFLDRWEDVAHAVHAIALEMDGSISAEHGIGRLKKDELAEIRSETDMTLMRNLKKMMDPDNLFNPGKLV